MSISHIFITALILVFAAITPAYAQNSNIAIVDMDKILSDSSAGKSIQTQLKSKRESFQKEFAARENTLISSEKSLAQQKSSLTPEAFETQRKQFETQLLETRNVFQTRRNALDKGLNNALSQLREKIMTITAQIAEKKGYSIVLTRDSVVIMDKELDITDEVLSNMNNTVKSIPLTVTQ